MASASNQTAGSVKGEEIPLAATFDTLILKNNQAYALEPDLDAEKAKIRQSQVMISCSVSGTVYAFIGPYL
jgi:hypothetical protein